MYQENNKIADVRSLLFILTVINIVSNKSLLSWILVDYHNATRSNPHHKTIQGSLYPTQSKLHKPWIL